MEFQGYRRKNGSVGIRNKVAVVASTGCINELTKQWSGTGLFSSDYLLFPACDLLQT